eukprot:CCRYP_006630-RC/>CCRYP_006630-RC protein AED:0.24 eAED:0.24 QI:0/0.33/0.25/1/0.33/0.25/4/610/455
MRPFCLSVRIKSQGLSHRTDTWGVEGRNIVILLSSAATPLVKPYSANVFKQRHDTMSTQFIIRSKGQNHPLNLKLLLHDGIDISKQFQGGVTVLEVSDVDAVIELVVRRRTPADNAPATAATIDGGDKIHQSGTKKKSSPPKKSSASRDGRQGKVRRAKNPADAAGKKSPQTESKRDSHWQSRFNDLVKYKSEFGHCNVRVDDKANSKLGYWVQRQRREYKDQRLAEDRIAKLNEIGFVWVMRDSWETRYNELVEYTREFGHCNITLRYKPNPELGKWVNHQREAYKKFKTEGETSTMTQERIDLLEAIGFVWKVEPQWNTRFSELVNYKREHGDCNVPAKYKPNRKLGVWVYRHRTEFKNGKLPQEHIKKLNDIGFSWNAHDSAWMLRYSQLMIYKREFGHCIVPQHYEPNPSLAEWVLAQRKHFKAGRLSEARIVKLNELGFTWEIRSSPKTS